MLTTTFFNLSWEISGTSKNPYTLISFLFFQILAFLNLFITVTVASLIKLLVGGVSHGQLHQFGFPDLIFLPSSMSKTGFHSHNLFCSVASYRMWNFTWRISWLSPNTFQKVTGISKLHIDFSSYTGTRLIKIQMDFLSRPKICRTAQAFSSSPFQEHLWNSMSVSHSKKLPANLNNSYADILNSDFASLILFC